MRFGLVQYNQFSFIGISGFEDNCGVKSLFPTVFAQFIAGNAALLYISY